MCTDYKKTCVCGSRSASFIFKDDVMPTEVIERIYCPDCSTGIANRREGVINDNGWVIEFDMEIAKFAGRKLPVPDITPEYLFDRGYCTWRGVYPMDHADSAREREELVKLSRVDPRRYLEEIKKWGIERMERLAREGWRKAMNNDHAASR